MGILPQNRRVENGSRSRERATATGSVGPKEVSTKLSVRASSRVVNVCRGPSNEDNLRILGKQQEYSPISTQYPICRNDAVVHSPGTDMHDPSFMWSCLDTTCSTGWRSHSTQLLIQTMTRETLKDKQSVIHSLTLGWTVTQYLSYSSNAFRSPGEYLLREDDVQPIQDCPSVQQSVAVGEQSGDVSKGTYRTVNGMARFLDSFGDIYGNHLSREARTDALTALEAVTHAWSTQWLFSDGPAAGKVTDSWLSSDTLLQVAQHKNFYAESWKYAHNLLIKTKGSPSFVRILAVFLFNMAETPEGVLHSLQPGETSVDLQDHALLQMKTLLSLVAGFASALPKDSAHRKLLESAAGVVHWYGYVRDTSVAMVHERRCNLDTIRRVEDSTTVGQAFGSSATTGSFLEALCQAAAARIIQLSRDVMAIRDSVNRPDIDIAEYYIKLRECCNGIESFHAGVGSLLQQHFEADANLSLQMYGCVAHILLTWSYGILMLIQYTHRRQDLMDEAGSLQGNMLEFERHAVASVSRLAARFAESTSGGKHDGFAMSPSYPLVARNSNIPLVTKILETFLAHAVESKAKTDRGSCSAVNQISVLLKSLLSLTRTMGGSSVPRAALQSLMARYPDDLMSLWAAEIVH